MFRPFKDKEKSNQVNWVPAFETSEFRDNGQFPPPQFTPPHRLPQSRLSCGSAHPSAREARAGLRGLGAEVRARRHWNRVHGEFSGLRFLSLDALIGVSREEHSIFCPGAPRPKWLSRLAPPSSSSSALQAGLGRPVGRWSSGFPLFWAGSGSGRNLAEPQPTARPGPQASSRSGRRGLRRDSVRRRRREEGSRAPRAGFGVSRGPGRTWPDFTAWLSSGGGRTSGACVARPERRTPGARRNGSHGRRRRGRSGPEGLGKGAREEKTGRRGLGLCRPRPLPWEEARRRPGLPPAVKCEAAAAATAGLLCRALGLRCPEQTRRRGGVQLSLPGAPGILQGVWAWGQWVWVTSALPGGSSALS